MRLYDFWKGIFMKVRSLIFIFCFVFSLVYAWSEKKIEIGLDTGRRGYILEPGSESQCRLIVSNLSDKSVNGHLEVSIRSFDDSVQTFSKDVSVSEGGRTELDLSAENLGKPGIKWMTCRMISGDNVFVEKNLSIAYMTPTNPVPREKSEMLFGIAYGAHPDNTSDYAAELSAAAGINTVRIKVNWAYAQPEPGPINWKKALKAFAVHEAVEIRPQIIVGGGAHWVVKDGKGKRTRRMMPRIGPWREWIAALAEKTKDRVTYWEIWNEPDIGFFKGTQDEYVQLLKAASEEIRKAAPDAKVMTGGFVSLVKHDRKKGLIERVIDECRDDYDCVAYHRHGEFDNFREEIDERLVPYCERVLGKKADLYFTETGMDTRFGQHFQASELVKKMVFAWSRGAVAYTWFNMHDAWNAENDFKPGKTYGLYTKLTPTVEGKPLWPQYTDYSQGFPKAAYVSLNTLTAQLGAMKFVKQYKLENDIWCFLFRNGERQVLVAWNQNLDRAAPDFLLRTDARNAYSVDLMSNRETRRITKGMVSVNFPHQPYYLVLEGAESEPEVEGVFAGSVEYVRNQNGREVQLNAQLRNPTSEDAVFAYRWLTDQGMTGDSSTRRIKVKAGDSVGIQTKLQLTAMHASAYGKTFTNKLQYKVESLDIGGTLDLPYKINAVRVVQGTELTEKSLSLERQSQVVNRYEHDPNTYRMMWKGGHDSSAHVSLGYADGKLRVKIAVLDDTFSSPESKRMREGDSIIIALADPDKIRTAMLGYSGRSPILQCSTDGLISDFSIDQNGDKTTYQFDINGIDSEAILGQLRFNVVVCDNDGRGTLENRLEAAPGLFEELDSSQWPILHYSAETHSSLTQ